MKLVKLLFVGTALVASLNVFATEATTEAPATETATTEASATEATTATEAPAAEATTTEEANSDK